MSAVTDRAAGELADAQARRRTAMLSVAAAAFLVAVKLVTGLATGSLAFIAEAAHSGTDLVAALLTLFAVQVAVRPPDRDHQFGHGKAEHLAALGESAFLMLVSLVIAYASVRRLIDGGGHDIDVTWWAFTVLAVVIAVDASRATVSYRGSKRYNPQPSRRTRCISRPTWPAQSPWLSASCSCRPASTGRLRRRTVRGGARGAAALRLAKQSVDVLMDRTAADADERIREALSQLDEQVEVRRVRVRHAAGRHFVDIVIGVPLDTGVSQAHAVADRIEELVERALGGADVVVHVEPAEAEGSVRERATAAASAIPEVREVHNVRVMRLPEGYELSLHVKLPRELSLEEAHGAVERLEQRVREEVPELEYVHTHIEPLAPPTGRAPPTPARPRSSARRSSRRYAA